MDVTAKTRVTGAEIVACARGWIGTPFRHQAAVRGAGCDCLGLVRGVWREMCGTVPFTVPAYTPDWSEPQREERLWVAASRLMRPKARAEMAAGNVVLFRMRAGAVAKHLGIIGACGDAPTFIHAYAAHGVVESPLGAPWQRRIVACFAYPFTGGH